jgi:hypothetical protein
VLGHLALQEELVPDSPRSLDSRASQRKELSVISVKTHWQRVPASSMSPASSHLLAHRPLDALITDELELVHEAGHEREAPPFATQGIGHPVQRRSLGLEAVAFVPDLQEELIVAESEQHLNVLVAPAVEDRVRACLLEAEHDAVNLAFGDMPRVKPRGNTLAELGQHVGVRREKGVQDVDFRRRLGSSR